jgi:hypothetical protein
MAIVAGSSWPWYPPPMTPKQYLDRRAQEWRGKALSVALSMGPVHHSESSRKAEEKTAPKRRPKK